MTIFLEDYFHSMHAMYFRVSCALLQANNLNLFVTRVVLSFIAPLQRLISFPIHTNFRLHFYHDVLSDACSR